VNGGAGEARTPDLRFRNLIDIPHRVCFQSVQLGHSPALSRENFETLLKKHEDPKRFELPAMFSWLSTQIPEYADTLNLKMYAHIQEPGLRLHFRLEQTDHPLSLEYHKGITPERVKEIMVERLRGNE
jgi:hypothetical protein